MNDCAVSLGPIGVCLPVSFTGTPPVDAVREAAVRLENAGYQAVWTNEVIGKDAFVQLAVLPAATERMVFGTFSGWATPSRRPASARISAARWRPCATICTGWTTRPGHRRRTDLSAHRRRQRPENACAGSRHLTAAGRG